ncbi:Choline/ethanolaminephosphotransferase [Nadsonia fulvescens var. elongata DSM 6958]|uniref:Choline/ethanolaminephosphotransferase n=1 Tax=Nadsonia fulvescens var. elongata DSM 6958 TaxID=857566 RepID=A0A1E3PTB3_9ASCO|nr:Choline/ethanolaminephosphotransferase [Nadsonia fulvescens var. elongata DSM 6958]
MDTILAHIRGFCFVKDMEESYLLKSEALVNLRTYKYQGVDKSKLSEYVLNPYWTWCAKFMPPSLAPNMITVIGFTAILFNVFSVLVWIPDLQGPAPALVYISFGLGLWFYQTMDNIDGKQARRTGSSSPLGELFDHGLDSINCALGGLIQAATIGLGSTSMGALTALAPCIAMYLSAWETYHTHVLYLGYINGPTEGILVAVLSMLVTGIYGPGIWDMLLIDAIPLSLYSKDFWFAQYTLRELWNFVIPTAILLGHMPACLYNVYKHKKEKREPFADTLTGLIPITALIILVSLWLSSPYSTVLDNNHLALFAITCSLLFGKITTAMTLAHLTNQSYPLWNDAYWPVIMGFGLFGFIPRLMPVTIFRDAITKLELVYLWAAFLFSVSLFTYWSVTVIARLCKFLNIQCFTIGPAIDLGKSS